MIKEAFELVQRDMSSKRMRALLTTLGVIIGVALIIILVSLGQAMENSIDYQFKKIGINSIRVVPGNLRGPPTGSLGLDKSLVGKIEAVRGVEYVNSILMQTEQAEFEGERRTTTFIGYDTGLSEKAFVDTDLKLREGRFFKKGEKGSVLIGDKIAKELFSREIRNQNKITIKGREFKVIGIFEKTGVETDNRIYLPLDMARELFNQPNIVNAMAVQVRDGFDVNKVGKDIEERLLRELEEDEFKVYTPEQLISQIQSIFGAVTAVLVAIASISIVVGAIGIMNAMFTSVLEKTKQIGTMKAIGARNRDVLFIFLIEAGVIGIIGGIIGAVIGVGVVYLIGSIIKLTGFELLIVGVEPYVVVGALIISFLIGIISGLVPAYRAARLNPVDALRYE